MAIATVLFLMLLLQMKHFVCDFLYQPPYMYKNKGTFGHLGGIVHSGFHMVVSAGILLFFAPMWTALFLAWAEFGCHYLIDWAKMNINAKMKWGPTTSESFWILLGFDQLLHQLTYLAIVAMVFI